MVILHESGWGLDRTIILCFCVRKAQLSVIISFVRIRNFTKCLKMSVDSDSVVKKPKGVVDEHVRNS